MIRNAVAVLLQTLVTIVSLFILYGVLIKVLGPEQLGLWSLVLATTSLSRVAELGFGGSVVKFVAKYHAIGEPLAASAVLQTAVISIAGFVGLLLPVAYLAARWILSTVLGDALLTTALTVLPFSLCSMWLVSIGSVFQSGLDANGRFDMRALVACIGQLAFLGMALSVVRSHGILGLAYCQVIQSGIVTGASWWMLKRQMLSLPLVPRIWRRDVFREIFGYAASFQVNGIVQMLFEPTTKLLLSNFATVSLVGYFEMANRMVVQARALLVSASQVLVPVAARLTEKEPSAISAVYRRSAEAMTILSAVLFSAVAIAVPAISDRWIGHYEVSFVACSYALIVAWWFNALAAPAYQLFLGMGNLRWNVASHVVIGLLNGLLGLSLGSLFGARGVVSGTCVAIVCGSALSPLAFARQVRIPWTSVFSARMSGFYTGAVVLAVSTALLAARKPDRDYILTVVLTGLVLLLLLFLFVASRLPTISDITRRLGLLADSRQ